MMNAHMRCICFTVLVCGLWPLAASAQEAETPEQAPEPVSFYRQVRPLLQRHCSGCHQPAKKGGELLLTTHADLLKGGESGTGVEPGKPDESLILDFIAGDEPEMPKNADPLSAQQVALIERWITEGAADDTPENLQETFSAENPPTYASPPVITAIDYSPDGTLLAVSGFHEILLHHADGSGLVGRLIGRSQRIESLHFSPDGSIIGAVGGTPALFGEVQFWSVAEQQLAGSLTISYDTLFGASFNSDGSLFAFGAADNRARVVRVADLEQIMRFDAHADYVLGTTFSKSDDHLITVSRDMSMKLVIVENAQFVDNVTSITPGALKGGLTVVHRHPQHEQVLTGAADGQPLLYKMFRTRKRIIGDDFNRIRSYEKLPGRIFDMQFNSDGSQFVVGSSTATGGAARIYRTGEYETDTVNNAGGLNEARQETAKRSAEKMLVHELAGIAGPVYAVAYRPDGKQVAVAGFEGVVRLFDAETGELVKEFAPVELSPTETAAAN